MEDSLLYYKDWTPLKFMEDSKLCSRIYYMNSVDNFKSTKLRKLFRILKSSSMQSLNIFRAREGFLFEFASLSGVWKFENIFC
jgi:hypothetical protein